MKSKFLYLLALFITTIETGAKDMGSYFIDKNKDSIAQVDGIDYFIKLFYYYQFVGEKL